jgi:PTH1 family peptidyl-tRNA hydrolase
MWLIVGLGNPGAQYELTRHNFGFLAIDTLLDQQGIKNTKKNFGGQSIQFNIDGHTCIALKPETFMNRSGSSVQQAMSFHKIAVEDVIVLHDDLDLPLGELRLKKGGGNGGHNGLKDISRVVGPEFVRIRLGISRPAIKGREADYVLSPFNAQELEMVEQILKKACNTIIMLITKGMDFAQRHNQLHGEKAD